MLSLNHKEDFMTLTTTDDNFARQLAELEQIQNLCKKLLNTPHYKKLGEEGIHAIISRAKALGIHPFEALNGGFHCINGKVGMSTEMMAALVRRQGHSVTKDPKSTSECVILIGKRKDTGDTWVSKFDKQDAINAGLWNSNTWKKYPETMLYNRAMSQLFRQLFPDLSLGAGYVEDELNEINKTGDYKPLKAAEVEVIASNDEPVESQAEATIEPEQQSEVNNLNITTNQIQQLTDLLLNTSEDFQNRFWTGLKSMNPPIKRMADIPQGGFENIRKRLLENQINPIFVTK